LAAAQNFSLPDKKAVFDAASKGDESVVLRHIDAGLDVNERLDPSAKTALMLAAMFGHTALVQKLLQRGADVHAQDDEGFTAFMVAAQFNNTAAAELLLDKGAQIDHGAGDGVTALMLAAGRGFADALELLLKRGAKHNLVDENGWSALMHAANFGDEEPVRVLLSHGADAAVVAADGITRADKLARDGGNTDLQKSLETEIDRVHKAAEARKAKDWDDLITSNTVLQEDMKRPASLRLKTPKINRNPRF
jgi:ankyrin repeat protein